MPTEFTREGVAASERGRGRSGSTAVRDVGRVLVRSATTPTSVLQEALELRQACDGEEEEEQPPGATSFRGDPPLSPKPNDLTGDVHWVNVGNADSSMVPLQRNNAHISQRFERSWCRAPQIPAIP